MPEEYSIRKAVPTDAEAISQIATESYAVYVEDMGCKPFPMLEDYPARIAEDAVFVLEIAGAICGYIVLLPGASLLVDNLAIAPEFQKRGFGKLLMDFAQTEAKTRGLASLTLYTNEAMTDNLAWYPKLGYRETGRKIEKGYRRVYFRKDIG